MKEVGHVRTEMDDALCERFEQAALCVNRHPEDVMLRLMENYLEVQRAAKPEELTESDDLVRRAAAKVVEETATPPFWCYDGGDEVMVGRTQAWITPAFGRG